MARCAVKGCSNEGVDKHHVLPVEYGGLMTGPTVLLCATHHDSIHRLFNRVKAGKLAISAIQDPSERLLVSKINEQYVVFVETGIAPNARRRVVVHCSQEELDMVHFLRDDGGFNGIEVMFRTWIRHKHNQALAGKQE